MNVYGFCILDKVLRMCFIFDFFDNLFNNNVVLFLFGLIF